MDISFLGGPPLQRGVGIVAPFDFALDRELWRWVPDDVSLHLTRTPFVPVEVSLSMARLISEHETLRDGVRALMAVHPEAVGYACTSGSFVGGLAGEAAMCHAMVEAGAPAAVTTSGALLDALAGLGIRRVAVVTPYTKSVTDALEEFLSRGGATVTGREYLGLTREIWRVSYRDVVEMARRALPPDGPVADALFISCTNLPTYDVIPQLEAELRMPVLSANQVTVWSLLRRIGKNAVGPYQSLLMPGAPTVLLNGPAAAASGPTGPSGPAAAEPVVAYIPTTVVPPEAVAEAVGEPVDELRGGAAPEPAVGAAAEVYRDYHPAYDPHPLDDLPLAGPALGELTAPAGALTAAPAAELPLGEAAGDSWSSDPQNVNNPTTDPYTGDQT